MVGQLIDTTSASEDMSNPPPYLIYLTLGESILIELAFGYTVIANFRTLYTIHDLKKHNISISSLLVFHILIWSMVAAITLVHNSYVLIYWNPNKIIYDIVMFYVTGTAYLVVVPVPAVSLFFSTLERCSVFIIHNAQKLRQIRMVLLILNTIAAVAFVGYILHAFVISAPSPFFRTTTNLSPGSLSQGGIGGDRFNTSRIFISFVNLFAALVLIYFIKKSNLQSQSQKTLANLVIRVLLVQTFLDLSVHAIAFGVSLISKASASNLLGPYARLFSAIDGFICCICVARSIQKIQKERNRFNPVQSGTTFRDKSTFTQIKA